MTAIQTPSGWYPDPSGSPGQRYFEEGTGWTNTVLVPLSDAERADRLAVAVAFAVGRGWRVESQTLFQAVLVGGYPINHVAHLLGMLVTCGLWMIGWIIAMMAQKPVRRMTLRVDPYGNIIRG